MLQPNLPRLRCISLLSHSLPKPTTINNVKQIHAQLITNGLKSPTLFSNLIFHYSHQQNINISLSLFHHFPHILLFNTLLKTLPPNHSLLIFQTQFSKGLTFFDHNTFNFLLGASARCPSPLTLKFGKQLHSLIIKHGFGSNLLVLTTKLHFYATNRDISSARKVFDEMPERTVVTWNAMITGYCNLKDGNRKYAVVSALCLFKEMLVEVSTTGVGVRPTGTTIVCVLSAASQLGRLETGACIHGFAVKTLREVEGDVFIGTGLVDMYSKCGCLDSALSVFWRMKWRNVLSWTALTTGFAIHGRGKEALEVLYKMEDYGVKPNETTFTSLLSACCHAGLISEGLQLFSDMKGKFGVTPLIQHYGCVVDLLGRAGKLKEAYDFVVAMPISPDVVIWRSLLSACKIHGDVMMGEKVGKFLIQLRKQDCAGLGSKSEDYVALSNVYASAERWNDVESLVVPKCMECGQALPESYSPPADEPWMTGIFGCAEDRDNCLTGLFCPCVLFGRNVESLTEETPWTGPCICHAIFVEGGIALAAATAIFNGVIDPGTSFLIFEGLFFTWWMCGIYTGQVRQNLQKQYHLKNSPCDPCCVHCCLHWCALCQEHREMKGRLSDNLASEMTLVNAPPIQEMKSTDDKESREASTSTSNSSLEMQAL